MLDQKSGELMNDFDLICIGSGPAGQRAAVQAAKLGKRVGLIEKSEKVGGICLHNGTIPSKTFREAVMIAISGKQSDETAYSTGFSRSSQQLFGRVEKLVNDEVLVQKDQLSRNNVVVIRGDAQFLNRNEISIKNEKGKLKLKSQNFLISVGSKASQPRGFKTNGVNIITSDEIFELTQIPRKLVIIGCGVIGIEYASMFAKMGVKVTVVDGRNRPLEFLDTEIVDELVQQMRHTGVTFCLGEGVENALCNEDEPQGVVVSLTSGRRLSADLAIVCAGRIGATEKLALGKAGLEIDERFRLNVNSSFQTNISHIFAAGDVIGYPSLAATSSEQGRLAALAMFSESIEEMSPNFPVGVYSIPEVSMVGMPEHELVKTKTPYETGIARFKEIARGNILGDRNGLLKLNFHRQTRQLLGVHIVGTGATELVHIGQCAMELGGGLDYFLRTVFNYPTLAECYKVAALDANNKM